MTVSSVELVSTNDEIVGASGTVRGINDNRFSLSFQHNMYSIIMYMYIYSVHVNYF